MVYSRHQTILAERPYSFVVQKFGTSSADCCCGNDKGGNLTIVAMAKNQLLKFTLASKNVLSLEETELYELTQLAGISLDPNVFKIILDLLKLNVDPTAVFQMLNSMSGQRRKKGEQNDTVSDSATTTSKQKFGGKGRQLPGRQRPDYK